MKHILAHLRKLLLFGLLTALLYPFLLLGLSAVLPARFVGNVRYPLGGYGHMHSRIREMEGHAPVDVLFIGSSHAYRGFDPRIWQKRGLSAFNLGSSAQTPLQSELLLEHALPILRPRLVIFEVHPGPFRDPGVESAVDLIANRPIDGASARMALRMRDAIVFNTLCYGMLRQASGLDAAFQEPAAKKEDLYVGDGFVQRLKGGFHPEGKLRPESTEPLPQQWSAFQRILAQLGEDGYPVILVEAPMSQWMYANAYRDHDRFAQRMSSSGRYIDMNGKVSLEDEAHFFTQGHLDQAGVELFNEALLDTLAGRGWLPDPEEDARP